MFHTHFRMYAHCTLLLCKIDNASEKRIVIIDLICENTTPSFIRNISSLLIFSITFLHVQSINLPHISAYWINSGACTTAVGLVCHHRASPCGRTGTEQLDLTKSSVHVFDNFKLIIFNLFQFPIFLLGRI